MTALRHILRLTAVTSLAVVPVLALVPGASAAHESSNHLDFDAVVAGSTADGGGVINYVKGASGDSEETSVWQQSLSFTGLEAGTTYTVVVKKGEGDLEIVPGTRDRTICTFTASTSGAGTCTGRFLELRALAVAQLQEQSSGAVVAQATRTGAPNPAGGTFTAAAPGEITSFGGCREPGAGSQCTAAGRK